MATPFAAFAHLQAPASAILPGVYSLAFLPCARHCTRKSRIASYTVRISNSKPRRVFLAGTKHAQGAHINAGSSSAKLSSNGQSVTFRQHDKTTTKLAVIRATKLNGKHTRRQHPRTPCARHARCATPHLSCAYRHATYEGDDAGVIGSAPRRTAKPIRHTPCTTHSVHHARSVSGVFSLLRHEHNICRPLLASDC